MHNKEQSNLQIILDELRRLSDVITRLENQVNQKFYYLGTILAILAFYFIKVDPEIKKWWEYLILSAIVVVVFATHDYYHRRPLDKALKRLEDVDKGLHIFYFTGTLTNYSGPSVNSISNDVKGSEKNNCAMRNDG